MNKINTEEIYIIDNEITVDEFYNNIYNNWEYTKGYEEVYAEGYDTGGNYHYHCVYSGHNVINKQLGVKGKTDYSKSLNSWERSRNEN